jgi:hypothetical protein
MKTLRTIHLKAGRRRLVGTALLLLRNYSPDSGNRPMLQALIIDPPPNVKICLLSKVACKHQGEDVPVNDCNDASLEKAHHPSNPPLGTASSNRSSSSQSANSTCYLSIDQTLLCCKAFLFIVIVYGKTSVLTLTLLRTCFYIFHI